MAVIDWLGAIPVYGVSSARVEAVEGGYELKVTYGEVSRPGLATPLRIEITKPGGFVGETDVAIDLAYLAMWDENGLVPAPRVRNDAGGPACPRTFSGASSIVRDLIPPLAPPVGTHEDA
ncbi:hypothetical protein BH24ACT3_BH24ACT3_03010 [soil metagenome]